MSKTDEKVSTEEQEPSLIGGVISRFDSDVFTSPFRVGRKQQRAILDSNGLLVILMPHNSQKQAQMYCDYLNGL